MKSLFKLFTSGAVLLAILLIGCDKEVQNTDSSETSNTSVAALEQKRVVEYSVECVGKNDCPTICGLEGEVGLDGNGFVKCKCNDCSMLVILKYSDGSMVQNQIEESSLNVPYFKDFLHYMDELGDSEVVISQIVVTSINGNQTVLFLYDSSQAFGKSVLYARAAGSTKTFQVDCHGSCECREVYYFDPPRAECSCSDCVMDVTEIQRN